MENKNPIVTIEMENGDKMVAELYPHIAPNTVNNFISLVKDGYYDGIIFHRVIKDKCPLLKSLSYSLNKASSIKLLIFPNIISQSQYPQKSNPLI